MSPRTDGATSRTSAPAKFRVTSPGRGGTVAPAVAPAIEFCTGGVSRPRTTISGKGASALRFAGIAATLRPLSDPTAGSPTDTPVIGPGGISDEDPLVSPDRLAQPARTASNAAANHCRQWRITCATPQPHIR